LNLLLSDPRPEVAALVGDPHPLVERIGSSGVLAVLPVAEALGAEPVKDAASLARFVAGYQRALLAPEELPAIVRAWGHGSRGEWRELLALDRELAAGGRLGNFAAASRTVGRSQLRRLLPLRDARVVRRYWEAAEAGEAAAWHVLVYGLALAVFSVPLRPGLLHYAQQTTTGLIASAAGPLRLDEGVQTRLIVDASAGIPAAVAGAISPSAGGFTVVP
jgi:urease accessory protein UreF